MLLLLSASEYLPQSGIHIHIQSGKERLTRPGPEHNTMAAAAVEKLASMDAEMSRDAQETAEAMEVQEQASDEDGDLYTRLKTLQRQLEFFEIQVRIKPPMQLGRSPALPANPAVLHERHKCKLQRLCVTSTRARRSKKSRSQRSSASASSVNLVRT